MERRPKRCYIEGGRSGCGRKARQCMTVGGHTVGRPTQGTRFCSLLCQVSGPVIHFSFMLGLTRHFYACVIYKSSLSVRLGDIFLFFFLLPLSFVSLFSCLCHYVLLRFIFMFIYIEGSCTRSSTPRAFSASFVYPFVFKSICLDMLLVFGLLSPRFFHFYYALFFLDSHFLFLLFFFLSGTQPISLPHIYMHVRTDTYTHKHLHMYLYTLKCVYLYACTQTLTFS